MLSERQKHFQREVIRECTRNCAWPISWPSEKRIRFAVPDAIYFRLARAMQFAQPTEMPAEALDRDRWRKGRKNAPAAFSGSGIR